VITTPSAPSPSEPSTIPAIDTGCDAEDEESSAEAGEQAQTVTPDADAPGLVRAECDSGTGQPEHGDEADVELGADGVGGLAVHAGPTARGPVEVDKGEQRAPRDRDLVESLHAQEPTRRA
jgi:hypothetical protein